MDDSGVTLQKGVSGSLGLLAGEKQLISFEYFNEYGVKAEPVLTWTIANPALASVTKNEITASAVGSTLVSISAGTASVSIRLTVVADPNAVSNVLIAAPPSTSLQVNQTLQLNATAQNLTNEVVPGKTFQWFSENSGIITVSSSGLVTAVANGTSEVHAKVDGVKSNSIKFNVGSVAGIRSGTFVSAGGYSSVGTVTMEEMGRKVIVKLRTNFQASVALGTFIYLANSTSGGNVKSAGVELGQWSNGAKTFEVPGVSLNQYKYVVVLCKPAGISFGFAELKP